MQLNVSLTLKWRQNSNLQKKHFSFIHPTDPKLEKKHHILWINYITTVIYPMCNRQAPNGEKKIFTIIPAYPLTRLEMNLFNYLKRIYK